MTFLELKTKIAQRLRRTDAATAAVIADELKSIHQDEIQSTPSHDWKCQEKRSPAAGSEGALVYTSADAVDGIELPDDFMRHRDLWVSNNGVLRPIDFIGEDDLREREARISRTESARPSSIAGWTIRNERLVLWPAYEGTDTARLRLDYYARLPFYTEDGGSDWFSIHAANALIFGTCWLVCMNHWDDARSAAFMQLYQLWVQKAVQTDKRNPEGPRRAYSPPREHYTRA